MKEVERTNAVIVHPNQWIEFVSQQNLYVIEVDHRNRNCRNRETGDKIGKKRRLEYENCYDLKLELRLYLGKDLRKDKGIIELVKHKDTGVYLCYIYY